MANLAVFASGNGSNFQVIAEAVQKTGHSVEFLLCNNSSAFTLERAKKLGIRTYLVSYKNRDREEVEKEIFSLCKKHDISVIALAGFMKLLTSYFLTRFQGEILNIHPSLLPKYAGVDAIQRSFESNDPEVGISIIKIDAGVDTGPVLFQKAISRPESMTIEETEAAIHALEHEYFPKIVIQELDKIQK
ncbi:MAG: phosphoribosylglycinamide formyltransferase [Spirochaetales bacterium]|nr:phosphoribosylglycinamide formyltransferase [Spirochaetales bacterium]